MFIFRTLVTVFATISKPFPLGNDPPARANVLPLARPTRNLTSKHLNVCWGCEVRLMRLMVDSEFGIWAAVGSLSPFKPHCCHGAFRPQDPPHEMIPNMKPYDVLHISCHGHRTCAVAAECVFRGPHLAPSIDRLGAPPPMPPREIRQNMSHMTQHVVHIMA